MADAYIYALADANDVRYVGKANDPHERLAAHLRCKSSRRVNRWLRSLGSPPTLIILAIVAQSEWQEAERYWIGFWRSAGSDLCNHCDGGEGVAGLDTEARARVSAAMKKRMNDPVARAKIFTPERALRISAASKGRKQPWTAALPQNQPGRRLAPAHADAARARLRSYNFRWPPGTAPIFTPEARAKCAAAQAALRGRPKAPLSRTHRQNISIAIKGRPKSAEHREKIRVATLKRWANRRATNGITVR